ncbi:MAG: trypsin-like peptidase domain-containing protein [Deltaproteobacteria bacterium]|nr:trypsin-like peptidase domain-containing protein [Deltaproteobacteria bacterium]
MKIIVRLLLAIALTVMLVTPSYAQRNLEEAIVKIYAVYSEYDYDMPWQLSGQSRGVGSGCIISGNKVLTNAHVVADQTFIQVKRAGQAKKYNAAVEVVAHECDLALLKVDDPAFFAGVKPLTLGDLPRMRDKVAVYGFPIGGEELSITEGVVSRVEHTHYSHSGSNLLSCQIDAAINPGNSGGPVIKNEKIVGIAFQGYMYAQSIGYMVPAPVIDHFLKDSADGTYDGIPGIGIVWQAMENPALRAHYQMKEEQTGVLLTYIAPGSTAQGIMQTGDVLLAIEGRPIANDGTIPLRGTERIHFANAVQAKFIGETVRCRLLRGGKIMEVTISLLISTDSTRLVPHTQYDRAPTYYIVGGLVFQPLTQNYLDTWDSMDNVPVHLTNYYYYGKQSEDRKQVIVLTNILADDLTVGYDDFKDHVITEVNGKRISTIADMVKAIEETEGTYHVFTDEWGDQIVLERGKINEAQKMILEKYKIDSARSVDLRGVQ